jgi:hypothetical protein
VVTWLAQAPHRCDSECLWELDWLHLPSIAPTSLVNSAYVASSTLSFAQWHHHPGHLSGSRLSVLFR